MMLIPLLIFFFVAVVTGMPFYRIGKRNFKSAWVKWLLSLLGIVTFTLTAEGVHRLIRDVQYYFGYSFEPMDAYIALGCGFAGGAVGVWLLYWLIRSRLEKNDDQDPRIIDME